MLCPLLCASNLFVPYQENDFDVSTLTFPSKISVFLIQQNFFQQHFTKTFQSLYQKTVLYRLVYRQT